MNAQNLAEMLSTMCACDESIKYKCPFCMCADKMRELDAENVRLATLCASQRKDATEGRVARKAAYALVTVYKDAANNLWHAIHACKCSRKAGACESPYRGADINVD